MTPAAPAGPRSGGADQPPRGQDSAYNASLAEDATQIHEPINEDNYPADADYDYDDYAEDYDADYDDDYAADDYDAEDGEDTSLSSDNIDATLARFSAVHDEIAEEEAARRKKFGWLFGHRREPELGKDIPFDFVESADPESTRLEWKRDQRKRRTRQLATIIGVAAALLVVLIVGVGWLA